VPPPYPPGTALAAAAASGASPVSKSNPQASQNRPALAVPHRVQGLAGTCGCGSRGVTAGGVAGMLAEPPILTPQTSQKSLLADV